MFSWIKKRFVQPIYYFFVPPPGFKKSNGPDDGWGDYENEEGEYRCYFVRWMGTLAVFAVVLMFLVRFSFL